MNKTKIDWCDSTWIPVTGCLHGCEYCYARKIAERFGGAQKYANVFDLSEPVKGEDGKIKAYPYSFAPTFHRYRLNEYEGKQGRNIFVCSMADLFGDWVPDSWIEEVFKACEKAPQHNYLFLTKNPKRYCGYGVPVEENMWYGISITKKSETHLFNQLPAFCNIFVSMEPLLEDLKPEECNIMFRQVKWVIIGAETGRRDKVVPKREWIGEIVNECRKAGIPVFMKPSLAGIWGEPLVQEFPEGLSGEHPDSLSLSGEYKNNR